MSSEPPTWRERQQEHQRRLAEHQEQTAAIHREVVAAQASIVELEGRIQAKKQQYDHPLFRWIFDRQLKKLDRQRRRMARLLDDVTQLEETCEELKQEVEKPPQVHFRRTRVVRIPLEAVFVLSLAALVMWLVGQWLLRG